MATVSELNRITLGEVELEYLDRGHGQPMLLLHGAGGPRPHAPFVDLLEPHARVIAPTHPGFAAATVPEWFDSIDDLAYLYLDLLEALDLHDVVLVGFSMGGWTAAEIAIKCAHRLAGLVLVDAVGIKISDRETRDIADLFATAPAELNRITFHNPANAPDLLALSDAELELVARNREASAMYLWEPYAHSPKLRRRLRRINLPTLVLWGESDGLVKPSYGRAYADLIANAQFELIREAGHIPQIEQPHVFADHVIRFLGERARPRSKG